jgi:hypothetical protein
MFWQTPNFRNYDLWKTETPPGWDDIPERIEYEVELDYIWYDGDGAMGKVETRVVFVYAHSKSEAMEIAQDEAKCCDDSDIVSCYEVK